LFLSYFSSVRDLVHPVYIIQQLICQSALVNVVNQHIYRYLVKQHTSLEHHFCIAHTAVTPFCSFHLVRLLPTTRDRPKPSLIKSSLKVPLHLSAETAGHSDRVNSKTNLHALTLAHTRRHIGVRWWYKRLWSDSHLMLQYSFN